MKDARIIHGGPRLVRLLKKQWLCKGHKPVEDQDVRKLWRSKRVGQ
jgi:hypothetical protein